MSQTGLVISLLALYAVFTAWLAWRGGQQMKGDASAFAIGDGKMSPWLAGLTLGACLASSSTFVIVPGFVYAEGFAALFGFTVPFIGGIALGLLALAPRFQDRGAEVGALTLPHWLGERYESVAVRRFFAASLILEVAYLVLITVGCAYVLEASLGVPYHTAVVGVVVFVFGYTGFGGALAHAYTNGMQAAVMLVVATLIFLSGAGLWADGSVVDALMADGWTHEGSVLFGSMAEVWVVPFLMGAALSTQPHLLTKALYVKGRRDLSITLAVGLGAFCVFNLVLFAGVYASLTLAADVPQDQVLAKYLVEAFASMPVVGAFCTVAILSASMSTLDGLLVAVAASVSNDLLPQGVGVGTQRGVLLALGLLTIGIAWSPPSLVLVLGQVGVYGLVAASAGPLLLGLLRDGPLPASAALWSGSTALIAHFSMVLSGLTPNPGVAASVGLAVGIGTAWWVARGTLADEVGTGDEVVTA